MLHLASSIALAIVVKVPEDQASVADACQVVDVHAIEVSAGAVDGGVCTLYGGSVTITGDGSRPDVGSIYLSDGATLVMESVSMKADSGSVLTAYDADITLRDVDVEITDYNGSFLELAGGSLEGTRVDVGGGQESVAAFVYGSSSQGAVVRFFESNFFDNGSGVFFLSEFNAGGPIELHLTDSQFTGNSFGASNGGAIRYEGGDDDKLVIEGSHFEGNAAANGGAVYVLGAKTEIVSTSFLDNRASVKGGAVYAAELLDGRIWVEDTWLCGNQAGTGGSGIYGVDLTLDLDHVAFVQHSGSAALGGSQAPVKANHVSMIANDVGFGIGDAMTIDNSLAWANDTLADGAGSVAGGYNAYGAGEVEQPHSTDIEIDDPGFAGDPTTCAQPPYLAEGSVLLGAAGDGSFIGSHGLREGGGPVDSQDSAVPESGLDSVADRGGPAREQLTWVSGGCGGGLPAALLLLGGGGLLLLRRRRPA